MRSIQEANQLATDNFHLIGATVAYYSWMARQIDDPEGVASLGLLRASRTWQTDGGASFKTWVFREVEQSLRMELRTTRRKAWRLKSISQNTVRCRDGFEDPEAAYFTAAAPPRTDFVEIADELDHVRATWVKKFSTRGRGLADEARVFDALRECDYAEASARTGIKPSYVRQIMTDIRRRMGIGKKAI